jgi:hypothetical protein
VSSAIGNGGSDNHSLNGGTVPQPNQTPENGAKVVVQTQPEGHSFWSHIFSFEHVTRPHQQPPPPKPEPPTQTAVWLGALKSMKLSSVFEGLDATPNFKYFALMAAFLGWLFVVYWVRQYELANKPVVSAPPIFTVEQTQPDRLLVSHAKMAFPGTNPQNSTIGIWQGAYAQPLAPGPGQALSASYSNSDRFGQPAQDLATANVTDASSCSAAEAIMPSEPIPTQLPILNHTSNFGSQQQAGEAFYPPAYNIQVRSATGPRLKTICNR